MGDVWSAVAAVGALLAAGIAVVARLDARKSAAAAETSAVAAKDSLDLQRAERDRATERTDVTWARAVDKGRPGMIRYRNAGSTTAHDVRAHVRVNGELHVVAAEGAPPDGVLELDMTDVYKIESVRAAQARAEMARSGVAYLATARFNVRANITWESARGTPGAQVVE